MNFFGRGVKPSISRQTQSMRFLMGKYPRVSRRLQRMYIYHWRAARGNRLWDSGLQSVSGKRRPAYYVFFRAIGKRARGLAELRVGSGVNSPVVGRRGALRAGAELGGPPVAPEVGGAVRAPE